MATHHHQGKQMAPTEHRTVSQLKEQIVRLAQDWSDAMLVMVGNSGDEGMAESKALGFALMDACAQLRHEESTRLSADLIRRRKP